MGDAKKRGSFAQRQAAAIQSEQERVRNLPYWRKPYPKHAALLAGFAGIVSGSTRYQNAAPKEQNNAEQ